MDVNKRQSREEIRMQEGSPLKKMDIQLCNKNKSGVAVPATSPSLPEVDRRQHYGSDNGRGRGEDYKFARFINTNSVTNEQS